MAQIEALGSTYPNFSSLPRQDFYHFSNVDF